MTVCLPPLPSGVHTLTNDETARLRAADPTLSPAPTRERCVTCRGAGEFKWWYGKGEDRCIEVYECPCRDQWLLHRFLLNAGLGLLYQRLGWDDVVATEPGALDKVHNYLANREAYIANGVGMIFHGTKGSGKTLLATLILKGLLGEGIEGYFTTMEAMVTMLTASWHSDEERTYFFRKVKNSGILVIDDPGQEHRQRKTKMTDEGKGVSVSTQVAETAINDVIRHRVAQAKPTIITTNMSLDQMQVDYGGNLISLLQERSVAASFKVSDFRDQSRIRLDEEIQLGLQRPLVIG